MPEFHTMPPHARLNVVLLIADDLALRHPPSRALMPHLATLASESVAFQQHYTSQPSCSPARTALLTGRRPDATMVYDLYSYWRQACDVVSLPQWFRQNGFTTAGLGKVFHPNHASGRLNASEPGGPRDEDQDEPFSWDSFYRVPEASLALECGAWLGSGCAANRSSWRAVPWPQAASLPDALIAQNAVARLRQLDMASKPYFLAAGFHRPHLPLLAPDSSFAVAEKAADSADLGPLTAAELMPAVGVPHVAWHGSGELTSFADVAAGTRSHHPGRPLGLTEALRRTTANALRMAYAAALVHLDECVGAVLEALRGSRAANRTLTAFTADHGFGLGTDGVWGKHHLFPSAVHVPFLLRVPLPHWARIHGRAPTYSESVDVFPTLALLAAGVRLPRCGVRSDSSAARPIPLVCTDGTALVDDGPSSGTAASGPLRVVQKEAAYFQHPAVPSGRAKRSPCVALGHCIMGYGLATRLEPRLADRPASKLAHAYTFNEWVHVRIGASGGMSREWHRVVAAELYNLSEVVVRGQGRLRNHAGEEAYATIEQRLRLSLRNKVDEDGDANTGTGRSVAQAK